MTEEVERSFARTFLNMLSTQSITYSDDYRQPPELSLRKVPVLPVSLSLIPFPTQGLIIALLFPFFCSLQFINH